MQVEQTENLEVSESWFRELKEIAGEVMMLPRRRDLFAPSRLGGSELLDEEWLQLSEELTRPERLEAKEDSDMAPVDEWTSALQERWRDELGSKKLKDFCEGEGREWLPASEETARLYLATLLHSGGIRATSLQPYLSAINNYHEDMGWSGPAKGISVTRAVTGITHVRTVHDAGLTLEPENRDQIRWLQACTYVVLAFISFGRPDTGTSLQQENVMMDEDGVTVHCGPDPKEGQEPQAEETTAVYPLVGGGRATVAPGVVDTVQG
eukprot:gene34273-biopygen23528